MKPLVKGALVVCGCIAAIELGGVVGKGHMLEVMTRAYPEQGKRFYDSIKYASESSTSIGDCMRAKGIIAWADLIANNRKGEL